MLATLLTQLVAILSFNVSQGASALTVGLHHGWSLIHNLIQIKSVPPLAIISSFTMSGARRRLSADNILLRGRVPYTTDADSRRSSMSSTVSSSGSTTLALQRPHRSQSVSERQMPVWQTNRPPSSTPSVRRGYGTYGAIHRFPMFTVTIVLHWNQYGDVSAVVLPNVNDVNLYSQDIEIVQADALKIGLEFLVNIVLAGDKRRTTSGNTIIFRYVRPGHWAKDSSDRICWISQEAIGDPTVLSKGTAAHAVVGSQPTIALSTTSQKLPSSQTYGGSQHARPTVVIPGPKPRRSKHTQPSTDYWPPHALRLLLSLAVGGHWRFTLHNMQTQGSKQASVPICTDELYKELQKLANTVGTSNTTVAKQLISKR